ncbi:MAG: GNAT family N-acetyltransferase, partial [Butyrivibrio sp.]|nr:GNAT family N-acetyltransferase [Butyrivibrio sp.]
MTKEKTEIYITKIDDDNKENFNALMSDYTYGCLDLYGYHGIGALIETTDGFLPVGVLIFSQEMFTIEDDTDEPFLNITWLYVDEQYRKTGIADKLILKFFQVAEAVSIDTRMVDIPLASQFDELVGVFEKWNFKFILADNPFIVFTKDNIAAWKNIKNPSKDLPVIDLEKLPAEKFKEYINNL